MKQMLEITVESLEGITQVETRIIDAAKGISVIFSGDKILQYRFALDNDSDWTIETAAAFINAQALKRVNAVLQAEIAAPLKQSYLSDDTMTKLRAVDNDPFFVPLNIKYGVGSNKQSFDKAFFEKAGAKFEGTTFFVNHSDLVEFGKANPIGSIVKFAGASDTEATFIAYVSAAEGTLRQKIKESQALGDRGFVKKVSIEGIPSKSDFTVDGKTGIKHFHDLARPTGIAIVNLEGLKGSQISA